MGQDVDHESAMCPCSEANSILGCFSKSTTRRSWEGILPLGLALVRPQLEQHGCIVQGGYRGTAPSARDGTELVRALQHRAPGGGKA